MSTKISQKVGKATKKEEIFSNSDYIDSTKVISDVSEFTYCKMPRLRIFDDDTGEIFGDLKKKGIEIKINEGNKNCHFYIGKYTKILRDVHYDKFVLVMSAKCAESYLSGIQKSDIIWALKYVRSKRWIDFKDEDILGIVGRMRFKDMDITTNYIPDIDTVSIMENFKNMRSLSEYRHEISVKNTTAHKGIYVGKRGSIDFFKAYQKSLEINKSLNEIKGIITKEQYDALRFKDVWRFEFTVRDVKSFESYFGISNTVDEVYDLLENHQDIIKKAKKKLFDKYFLNYKPRKKRNYGELKPIEAVLLKSLLFIKEEHNYSVVELEMFYLSTFEGNSPSERNKRSRMKKKFYELMDILYSNESKLKKQLEKQLKLGEEFFKLFY
jgi:hypothetical protein